MRLGQAIFFGAAAGLLTLAAPTLARNSSTNSPTAKATEAPPAAILPCLSAGRRRLVGATALSGDGFQGVSSTPLRRKERDRRNAVSGIAA